MIIFPIIGTLIVCLTLLWPRSDGGGIAYSLALVCAPCIFIGFGIIAAIWALYFGALWMWG